MFFDKPSNYSSSDYRSRNFKGDWTKHFINAYIDSASSVGSFKTMSSFYNYKEEHLPSSLYKFMPPSIYSLASILQETVYMSTPLTFNDPFDSYMCVNEEEFIKMYILQELEFMGYVKDEEKLTDNNESTEKLTRSEYWKIFYSRCEDDKNYNKKSFFLTAYEINSYKSEAFNKLWNELHYKARKECEARIKYLRDITYKISCFSNFADEEELMENTTMWSHYADNHRGFCVKYSMDFTETHLKDILLCGLFPVKYSSRTEKITPKQLLNFKEENGVYYPTDAIKKKVLKSLLTKSRFWSYEKEWRLIISKNDCSLLYKNNIPFPKIEAIYLGCRIDESIAQLIIESAEKLGYKVFQTKKSESKFTLSCSEVNSKNKAKDEYYYKLKKADLIENKKDRSDFEGLIFEEYRSRLL